MVEWINSDSEMFPIKQMKWKPVFKNQLICIFIEFGLKTTKYELIYKWFSIWICLCVRWERFTVMGAIGPEDALQMREENGAQQSDGSSHVTRIDLYNALQVFFCLNG